MALGDRSGTAVGVVGGYVLRMLRESIPRTQARLAEDLGVDLGTVQGWESGRRPLARIRAGDFLSLRRRLALLGADHALRVLLDPALDADRVRTAVLHPPVAAGDHPLAGWVLSRETAHMIAWAVRGIIPPALDGRAVVSRRGTASAGPTLAADERAVFFDSLRSTAERASGTAGQEQALLLRRQVLYLASYDPAADAKEWAEQALRPMRAALARRGYSPRWIEARTAATVAARRGDPELLKDFVENALVGDERGELANLAYWAYWLGAMPSDQPDDGFMHAPAPAAWNPLLLFGRLVESLHEAPGTVDLYIHSITTLLASRPWLAQAAPQSSGAFSARATELLDGGGISGRSRRDLQSVQYRLQRAD